MSKKAESPVHIEWSYDWVRAANIASGQTAEAETITGLGSILTGVREAIVGVSRKLVFLKTVRLPKAAPDDLRRILSVQLGQIFPVPLDQLAFDFIQTNDIDAEGCLTLVAAMRADDLRRIRADLQQAGLTASRVLPIALASPAVATRSRVGTADALVVDPDLGGVAFDVVRGGIVRLTRVTPADSDVDCEAKRTLAAMREGDLPRILGGEVGGAARAAGRPTLNLLYEAPPFAFTLEEDREIRIREAVASRMRLAGLLMVSAVLLLLLVWVNRMDAMSKVNRAQASWARQLVKLNSRRTHATDRAQAATAVSSSLETAFSPAQPLSDVALFIGDQLPKGAWLNEIDVERGKAIDIRGSARTSTQVADFVHKLGASPRFRDVRLVFANSATVGKIPVVQFNVNAIAVGNLPMPAPARVTGMRSASAASAP